MSINGLTIIGESINASVPATQKLFDTMDVDGIQNLTRLQDIGGAAWIDVNVGLRDASFMARIVREVQAVTRKPLSIDSPDPDTVEAGLQAYDYDRAEGRLPILNSIAESRAKMFSLYEKTPFMPILLSSEQDIEGMASANRDSEANYQTAKRLLNYARDYGIPREACIFDPGIAPIGTDTEGLLKMTIDTLRKIKEDPAFTGTHCSVGLSNFTVMLPAKKSDGTPVKGPLESAFLTLAMPNGLDFIIGNVNRKHSLLSPEHPAMACLKDAIAGSGYDGIMRVMAFYS